MKKRRPGRPSGTKKNGETSPNQKLKLLRTKSWVWICSHFQSGSQNHPTGVNRLAIAANAFSSSPKNKTTSYDGGGWSKWRAGKKGATPETIKDLWPEAIGAYKLGPWTNGSHKEIFKIFQSSTQATTIKGEIIRPCTIDQNFIGGFVPLWSAISGKTNEILKDWRMIPQLHWIAWSPYDNMASAAHNFEYVPEEIKDNVQLYRFANSLVQAEEQIPPLLALTAAITIARLKGDQEVVFFTDKKNKADGYLDEKNYLTFDTMKPVCESLAQMNISFQELVEVCDSFDLTIHCPNMRSLDMLK